MPLFPFTAFVLTVSEDVFALRAARPGERIDERPGA